MGRGVCTGELGVCRLRAHLEGGVQADLGGCRSQVRSDCSDGPQLEAGKSKVSMRLWAWEGGFLVMDGGVLAVCPLKEGEGSSGATQEGSPADLRPPRGPTSAYITPGVRVSKYEFGGNINI